MEEKSMPSNDNSTTIRYSPDNGQSWRMAEVKRYGGSYIHISENQRKKAALDSEVYDLFLVTPTNVIRLITSVDFGDKQIFSLIPEDYFAYFTNGSTTSEIGEV